ncbi:replication protein [Paenibacillus sp. strain BS8-2]
MEDAEHKGNFTQIGNDVLEHVARSKFNGTQFSIILVILRYTDGFHRNEHEFSIGYLAKAICANPVQVKREIKKLIEMNVVHVIKSGDNTTPRTLALNKELGAWRVGTNPLPLNKRGGNYLDTTEGTDLLLHVGTDPLPRVGTNSLPKKESIKENSKESIERKTRNKKNTYSEDHPYYQMAVYFHQKIMEHAEANGKAHLVKNRDMQKWADEFRLIIEIDKPDKQELKRVIDWSTSDPFWQLNILSPSKLRDKYVDLAMQMDLKHKGRPQTGNRQLSQNEQLMREIREEELRDKDGTQEAFSNHQQFLFELPDRRPEN